MSDKNNKSLEFVFDNIEVLNKLNDQIFEVLESYYELKKISYRRKYVSKVELYKLNDKQLQIILDYNLAYMKFNNKIIALEQKIIKGVFNASK